MYYFNIMELLFLNYLMENQGVGGGGGCWVGIIDIKLQYVV